MRLKTLNVLVAVLVLVGAFSWFAIGNPTINFLGIYKEVKIHEGLDLQGGMQVTLEGKNPDGSPPTADQMQGAKDKIERRVNLLGVAEPLVQIQGSNRIIVELPGVKDPEQAIAAFQETGLLEFIDAGSTYLPPGTLVSTSLGPAPSSSQSQQTPASGTPEATPGTSGNQTPGTDQTPAAATTASSNSTAGATAESTPSASQTPSGTTTPEATPATGAATQGTPGTGDQGQTQPAPTPAAAPVYNTIVTGNDLDASKVSVSYNQLGQPLVLFGFKGDGSQKFADFTTANVGKYMAIVMDKRVVSCPSIKSPITGGSGEIEGVTLDEAKTVVIQLKSGALPIPLDIVQDTTVGPTLGQDSVQRSLTAGIVGLGIVMAFMVLYFRLPGLLADIALLMYTALVFGLFKLIPVTLTLAGIAGFILSIGMAVDANVLIFARMKEELRAGKTLGAAIDAGFKHAWPSIRDSNMSTIITCIILYWFGDFFGASIIKGFALTLGIGVVTSLFTAVFISRTLLQTAQQLFFPSAGTAPSSKMLWLFGLSDKDHVITGQAESTAR